VVEEMKASGWYYKIWQSFAVLLPVRSVGVMGDERTYDYTIAIRAVESQDGMTADWVKLPYDLLEKLASRIINEVKGVNRCVSSTSPASRRGRLSGNNHHEAGRNLDFYKKYFIIHDQKHCLTILRAQWGETRLGAKNGHSHGYADQMGLIHEQGKPLGNHAIVSRTKNDF
jgi:hypothetical protein